jgi:hypothetical protein
MSLEQTLAVSAGKASLLDSLSFDVPPSAPYVTTRRSCYSYPSSGSTYSYATQRVIRIPITSDGGEWLDPSTLRVQLTFTNTTSTTQTFSALDPMCFIHRLRIFMAGTLVEDVMYANRVNELMRAMSPPGTNSNDAIEGFGVQSEDYVGAVNTADLFTLFPGHSITVSVRLNRVSGVLSCGKDFPLRFCPMTLELELADGDLSMNTGNQQNSNYTITAACCRHDFITLDSSLESEFVSKLLSNKQLLLAFNSFNVLYQTLGTSNDTTIAVQRAFTRLNKLFCFFAVDANAPIDTFLFPTVPSTGTHHDGKCYKWQLSLGSRNFPERRVETIDEMYAMLSAAAGRDQTGQVRPWSISGKQFRGNRHVLGCNFMRTPSFGSGVSTRAGDVIRLALYDRNPEYQAAWLVLQSDVMISITESGVSVMD